jgi:hypothetical protein
MSFTFTEAKIEINPETLAPVLTFVGKVDWSFDTSLEMSNDEYASIGRNFLQEHTKAVIQLGVK